MIRGLSALVSARLSSLVVASVVKSSSRVCFQEKRSIDPRLVDFRTDEGDWLEPILILSQQHYRVSATNSVDDDNSNFRVLCLKIYSDNMLVNNCASVITVKIERNQTELYIGCQ